MQDAQTIQRIRQMYQLLRPGLDERLRRQWAAAEAGGLGRLHADHVKLQVDLNAQANGSTTALCGIRAT